MRNYALDTFLLFYLESNLLTRPPRQNRAAKCGTGTVEYQNNRLRKDGAFSCGGQDDGSLTAR